MIDTNLTSNDIERETAKAVLVRVPNGASALSDKLVWLPKSQIAWQSPTNQPNMAQTLHLPEWLAAKL